MAGGTITVQHNISGSLVVSITRAGGGALTVKNTANETVSMPDTITATKTYVLPFNEKYNVSVKRNGVEIANTPDGIRAVDLVDGNTLTFAPSPDSSTNTALAEVTAVAESGVYGQVAKITSGTIEIAEAEAYQSTGLEATLVAPTSGVAVGTTDTFAVKNTSGKARVFRIQASTDVSTAATNAVGIRLALNGVSIPSSECRGWAIVDRTVKLNTTFLVTMQPNDEVALFITNVSGTGDITFLRGRIVAEAIG